MTFLFFEFADLVSLSSISIEFHIFGNKAEINILAFIRESVEIYMILFYLVQLKN